MKTRFIFLAILALCPMLHAPCQIPQGFNYQAIARDGVTGNPIANTTIKVKLSVLSDTTGFYGGTGGVYIWEEEHTNVKTNSQGMFTIVLGSPTATKVQGSAASFSVIDWSGANIYVGTKTAQAPGYVYKVMGSAKLWSVPYSMMANDIGGSLKKLTVAGQTINMEEPLFEVKNNKNQTVFAVYNEGVRIYVDDGDAKGLKGGFAIGGFDASKAPGQEYFRVTRDSTRIYVNQLAKPAKGGFAIGGFDPAKGPVDNFMDIKPDNYFIGQRAGYSNKTGLYNSFVGYESGMGNESGSYNSFFGYQTGKSSKTGDNNTFIGHMAGLNQDNGSANTFIGTLSGRDFFSGSNNTYLGVGAGALFKNGNSNIFIGNASGLGYNFPVGATGGSNNVAIGTAAGYTINTGSNNVLLGNFAGAFLTSGSDNVIMGFQSGYSNSTGVYNVFIGYKSGFSNTSGFNNTFLGYQSGLSNATGNTNVFIGNNAGRSNSSGGANVYIGDGAGLLNTTGSQNVFIGKSSGNANTTGGGNVFLGWNSGLLNTEGFNNVFLGLGAGYSNTTAPYNTFVGFSAGLSNQTGQFNTYIGSNAGRSNTYGSGNVVVGESAAYANVTGDNNTIIGNTSGINLVNGSGNVFLGAGAAGNITNSSNKLFIENSAADFTGALIYGEFDNDYLRFNANTDIFGRLGVGKNSAGARLDIAASNWDVLNTEGDMRIGDGNYRFKVGVSTGGGGAGDVRLTAHGGTNRLILGGGGKEVLALTATQIYPWTDNTFSLGLSSNRWTTVYAVNGTINTSDSRLKTNIANLDYGIDQIMRLRPVSFNWKDKPSGEKMLGLLAQEVYGVVTEVVDTGTDDFHTLGINYSGLIPVLIKGIQEQQEMIKSQQQLIESQKTELQSLREEMEQIKAMMTGNR